MNWSQQTVRLFSGTDTTVYAFLPQICAAYLLVVSLQKRVKTNKKHKNKTKQQQKQKNNNNNKKRSKTGREKKNGKGTRRNFCTHGSSYLFKYFQSLPSTPVNRSKLQVLPFKNSSLKPRRLFPSTGKNPLIISVKQSMMSTSHFCFNSRLQRFVFSYIPVIIVMHICRDQY